MIEFLNISKTFKNNFWEKDFFAVKDVSFKINQGELVGFLGANGAGKTTLIKILMDFSRESSGQVIFDPVLGSNIKEIKKNLGYLPEKTYLYQHLTGREFLYLSASLSNLIKNDVSDLIKKWSEKMLIDHALDRQIKTYSKGMQQRLGFISSILHRPKFLILDEPLSGLDPIGRRDFKKVMKELNEEGTTIFFSSHVVSDVEELCSKVVFIEKGSLIYNGSIQELIIKNSKKSYTLRYMKENDLMCLECSEFELSSELRRLLNDNCSIISVNKDTVSLEEIIYKIKS